MTQQEQAIWAALRDRQLGNFRFRRHHIAGPYILDFVCLSSRLVIEIDGGQHAENPMRDIQRDDWLREHGFKVLHFWNHQVDEELDAVLETILSESILNRDGMEEERTVSPHPPGSGFARTGLPPRGAGEGNHHA
jgi:very-short-patch-repair endonuclease